MLRLRAGEALSASDGAGHWRLCRFLGAGRLEPAGGTESVDRPLPSITVAFALIKAERPEWTVQKLVELGVDRIVVLHTARSVVRWDPDKAVRQRARLDAIARGAAMQSRRVWLPVVEGPLGFDELVQAEPDRAFLAHPQGGLPSLDRPTALVGPEGGWDEAELSAAVPLVSLATTVLRAETAAMAAGCLLCALRAGVVAVPGTPS